jgi:uncharacterized RmlC-like cupin family protein
VSEVRVVRSAELSEATGQTPGMHRRAAIDRSGVGSEGLWVGVVTVEPGARTGAHHHGDVDSVVCVTQGRLTIRYGENLEQSAEAGAGDFIYIPARVVHQEVNLSNSEGIDSIVIRSGDNVVVNVEMPDSVLRG